MKSILETDPYFVMSTGRTGTTFLTEFLNRHFPSLGCFQEPRPSWVFNVYSNLYCEGRLKRVRKIVKNYFIASRNRLVKNFTGRQYIEINPFIYGMGDIFKEAFGEIKILHLVRHPLSFISSALNFRSQGWRAHCVDLPIWNLNVEIAWRKQQICWRKLSKIQRKAWQWCYINDKIQSYQEICKEYLCVKFEDLLSEEHTLREETMKKILSFLKLPKLERIFPQEFERKVNPSQASTSLNPAEPAPEIREAVSQICGPFMQVFDYSLERPTFVS